MIKKRKNHKSPFNSAELQSATRGKVLAAGRLQPPFGKGCQYLMLRARVPPGPGEAAGTWQSPQVSLGACYGPTRLVSTAALLRCCVPEGDTYPRLCGGTHLSRDSSWLPNALWKDPPSPEKNKQQAKPDSALRPLK